MTPATISPLFIAAGQILVMERSDVIRKLKRLLAGQDFVSHAYLFGSVAEGKAGPLSDIDVAVSLKQGMSVAGFAKKKMLLINAIAKALGTDNFDLVVIEGAKLSMKHNIINGIVLKDGPQRLDEEVTIMDAYLDRRHYDEIYDSALMDRIAARGLL